jgi:beta-glucosidase
MEQKPKLQLKFPKRFLWGAATSAHQVEGDTHNQWSAWELENAKSLAKQAEYKLNELPVWDEVKDKATDPNNYISGTAVDHFNRYETDFDILAHMNMNAFRFSIEWSRIEPQEGQWDLAAIDHYRKYIQALKKRNIEPVVTLMHWTLPVWFHEKGGFEKRRNVKYFVRFARKIFEEYGQDIRYICTINEPEVYAGQGWIDGNWPPNKSNRAQALWVYLNLAYAHRQVYKAAKKFSRRLKVGMSKDVAHHYLGDERLLTRYTLWVNIYINDYLFLNRIRRHMDWLGLNYYFSYRYEGKVRVLSDAPMNDLGWEMKPQDLQPVLERLYKKYKTPIIITESGVADQADEFRKTWIISSITAMYRAMQNGVKIEGYLHWSLLDNFEWAYGKWPRFGLIGVDYETMKRTPRKSAIWFAKVIKQMRDA